MLENSSVPNNQVELMLLNALITKPSMIDDVSEMLSPRDFQDPSAGRIFDYLMRRNEKGQHIDYATMLQVMAGKIDADIITTVCNPATAFTPAILEHARMVKDRSLKQRIQVLGQRLIEMGASCDTVDDDLLAAIEHGVNEINDAAPSSSEGLRSLSSILELHEDLITKRYKNRGKLIGVDTGFKELNRLVGGWQPKTLVVLGARPSIGKTAVALHMALATAQEDYAAFFSIETGEESLSDRLLASTGKMNLRDLKIGRLTDADFRSISNARETLRLPGDRLMIDTNGHVTVPYIRRQLRRFQRRIPEEKRLVVYIDYLQLIRGKGNNTYEVVSGVSRDLKALAKELNCTIVALAQLNRRTATNNKGDTLPTMADLKESGQIEQDGDIIGLLHREDYFNDETERKNIMDLIIAKNKDGPTGTISLYFDREQQRFEDLTVAG